MRIVTETLHNFRRLVNTSVRFGEMTLLVGQNESGKSTILESIFNVLNVNSKSGINKLFTNVKNRMEFEIKIVVELDQNDIDLILSSLGLSPQPSDKYLLHQKFVFEWRGNNLRETKTVQSRWEGLRKSYGNDTRFDAIIRELINYAHKSVVLLRPGDVINGSETFVEDSRLSGADDSQYILNHLYRLRDTKDKFGILQKYVSRFFKKTEIDIIRKDSDLIIKIIKSFRGDKKELYLIDMSDGFRKILTIILKTYILHPSIILVDEPDSSLHSNLTRELFTYFKALDAQIILSTHNEIILGEFKQKEVKFVYPISPISSKIKDFSGFHLNEIIADLGLNFKYRKSEFLSAQLIISVEGENDEVYLHKLFEKTGVIRQIQDYRIAFAFGGGNKIIDLDAIDKLNKNPIPILVVRDGDEIDEKNRLALEHMLGNRVHIWKRREIENYVLSLPSIIATIKEKSTSPDVLSLKTDDINQVLKSVALSLTNKVAIMTIFSKYKKIYLAQDQERISEFIHKYDQKSDKEILSAFFSHFLIPTVVGLEQTEQDFDIVKKKLIEVTNDPKRTLEIYPGKDLIRLLNEWSNSKYHVSFSFDDLLKNIPVEEIDTDFKLFVDKIVNNCGTEIYKYLEQSNEIPNEYLVNVYKGRIASQSPQLALAAEGNQTFLGADINSNILDENLDSIAVTDYLLNRILAVVPLNRHQNTMRTTVYDLRYESSLNNLIAVAEIYLRRPNERFETAVSSLLIIEPKTPHLVRHSIFFEDRGQKEGNIDQVRVYKKNNSHGTIYFTMIYFNGGSNLYCVDYDFRTNKFLKQRKYNPRSDPGPRSLFLDQSKDRLYTLVNHSLAPYLFVVCCRCNRLIDKIKLPANIDSDGSVRSDFAHHKNAITLDQFTDHLMVIENSKLFDIDPFQRTVKKIKINKNFEYVLSNPNTKNTYFISSDYDEESENPYSNSLNILRKDKSVKCVYRFSNEITVNEIELNLENNLLYVVGKHNDIEDEYGVWVFRDKQSS